MFVSHSSLWTDFGCVDADKTRVYLERSKSSPITLRVDGEGDISPQDPLLQVIPHAADRLKSLFMYATPERINPITTLLSRPAPHLEYLSIDCNYDLEGTSGLTLPTTLFNGDLSSLRELHLEYVHTELPWRNMVNLTSFTLGYSPLGEVSIGQYLDFLESAPRLERIWLQSATSTSGDQDGRLVSLACLNWMEIGGSKRCSLLLDHFLIPVGANLGITVNPFDPTHLPRRLDNLKNLSDFTDITLCFDRICPVTQFSGPNGQLTMTCASLGGNPTSPILDYLAHIDTSKTERLEIGRGNPPSRDLPYRVLLRMRNLRTLKLSRCQSPHFFIRALNPGMSSSRTVVCPELEELVLVLRANSETFNIKDFVKMATARALGGAKLGTVRIVCGQDELDSAGVLELRKHVSRVEYCRGTGTADDDSDGLIDESDDSDDSEDSGDSDDSDNSSEESSGSDDGW